MAATTFMHPVLFLFRNLVIFWYGITCHGMQPHATAYDHKIFCLSRSLHNILCHFLLYRYILRSAAFLLPVVNLYVRRLKMLHSAFWCKTEGICSQSSATAFREHLVARLPAYRITFPKFILKSKTAGAERKLFFGSTPTLIGLVLPSRVHLSMPVAYNNQCRTPFVRHKYITVRLYIELLLYIFFFF